MKKRNSLILVRLALPSMALALIFSSCITNPVTGRKELTGLVSPQQELQLGMQSFNQMKKELPIDRDPAANAMVQRVGRRLAAVADKDMPNAQWEFVVFDSKEANAFCLPGGKIGVYKGILPIAKDDAGLATVLAHEIGHAVSHHGAERISQAQLLQAGGQVLGAATQNAKPLTQTAVALAYGVGGQLGYVLPFSRKQESEADHIGLIYMARAGYEPRQSLDFWQRFESYIQQQGGSKVPSLLSDHPVTSKRIEDIAGWMPEAEREYAARNAGGTTLAPTGRPRTTGSEPIGQPKRR